jgi:hypothetical protein
MMPHLLNKLIFTAALAAGTSLVAAETPNSGKAAEKPVTKAPLAPSDDRKKDVDKFSAQRDTMLTERQALITQLRTASEEHRKAILEKMKELGEAQRELSKHLRDELRKQRQR